MQDEASSRLVRMFQAVSAGIDRERDHLSELDGAIGDADHGITMSIGFQAVNAELARLPAETMPAEVLGAAAFAFLDAVGASTGPLYATAFQRAGRALKAFGGALEADACAAMVAAMASGIAERGKSGRGDKTMLDAWLPAAEAAARAARGGVPLRRFWDEVEAAAASGAEGTRSMVAARGRASRLGARSLGHVDPGAASALIVIRGMAETLGGE